MKKVTWDDLTMNIANVDIKRAYKDWNWILNGQIRPMMITKFGDMFFQSKDSRVVFLDTLEGRIVDICSSEEEFITFINKRENIENYLFSYIVVDLINKDRVPKDNECYSFSIPPILGGKIGPDNVSIIDFEVAISVTGQLHRRLTDLPDRTSISEDEISDLF